MSRLKKNSHFFTTDKIWKIVLDEKEEILVIESRDELGREAKFTAASIHGGLFWVEHIFEEPWWTTLQTTETGVALFTELAGEDSPTAKSITAFHIDDGKVMWKVDGALESANAQFVNLRKADGSLLTLQLKDGKTAEKQQTSLNPTERATVYPSRYLPNTDNFNLVAQFLAEKYKKKAVLAIDYAIAHGYIFIGFYETEGARFRNTIFILTQKDGELIGSALVAKNLKGLGDISYFIYENQIFYVDKGECVVSLNLPRLAEYD